MRLIYKLTSPSGKSYIGQTKREFELRLYEHYNSKYTPIGYAFTKYPNLDDWSLDILEQDLETLEETNLAEIKWISHYDSFTNGYNNTAGGGGLLDSEHSDGHKQKISEARKKYFETEEGKLWKQKLSEKFKTNNPCKPGHKPWNTGVKDCFTEETIKKMSEAGKERFNKEGEREKQGSRFKQMWIDGVFDNRPKQTPEQIAKRALAQRGFKQTDYQKQRSREANTGKLVEQSTKDKLSQANKGRILPLKTCKHCGHIGNGGGFNMYHNDNCLSIYSEEQKNSIKLQRKLDRKNRKLLKNK